MSSSVLSVMQRTCNRDWQPAPQQRPESSCSSPSTSLLKLSSASQHLSVQKDKHDHATSVPVTCGRCVPACNMLLATYIQQRRQQLEMTIVDACVLSGLVVSHWCALETGWIPNDTALLYSISGTLMISADRGVMLAMISQSVREYAAVTRECL